LWRARWETADRAERAYRQVTEPPPPPGPTATRTPGRLSTVVRALVAAAVVLVTLTALRGSVPERPPAMTGLYNILLVPATWAGPEPPADLAGRLQSAIGNELRTWATATPSIEIRGPGHVPPMPAPSGGPAGAAGDAEPAFAVAADTYGADVVLRPRFRSVDGLLTTTMEIYIAERTLGETPEFVGRHDLGLTEPLDVVHENLSLNEHLAASTVLYLKAVVAFVRGLGDYARADFSSAENNFAVADREFDAVAGLPGDHRVRRAVVHMMLGNAVGAGDIARADQAAEHFRQALAEDPGYARAEVGLAESLRVAVTCTPEEPDPGRLNQAAGHYRAALARPAGGDPARRAFVEIKARLGLGLTDQCLSLTGAADRWAAADAEFAAVLRLAAGTPLRGTTARQARWLAAEARAGQALTALVSTRAYAVAAAGYEEALDMLAGIDVVRSTHLKREITLLRNLRYAYEQQARTADVARTDARIARAEQRLRMLPTGG
jgi:hypothetical protein